MDIYIGKRTIGLSHPTYFIADIAANHDGDLDRAKLLIRLAKEAGADAAKFQNFSAPKIVSDYGSRSTRPHPSPSSGR
jgi:sialic acid synthase SpsE